MKIFLKSNNAKQSNNPPKTPVFWSGHDIQKRACSSPTDFARHCSVCQLIHLWESLKVLLEKKCKKSSLCSPSYATVNYQNTMGACWFFPCSLALLPKLSFNLLGILNATFFTRLQLCGCIYISLPTSYFLPLFPQSSTTSQRARAMWWLLWVWHQNRASCLSRLTLNRDIDTSQHTWPAWWWKTGAKRVDGLSHLPRSI